LALIGGRGTRTKTSREKKKNPQGEGAAVSNLLLKEQKRNIKLVGGGSLRLAQDGREKGPVLQTTRGKLRGDSSTFLSTTEGKKKRLCRFPKKPHTFERRVQRGGADLRRCWRSNPTNILCGALVRRGEEMTILWRKDERGVVKPPCSCGCFWEGNNADRDRQESEKKRLLTERILASARRKES